MSDLHTKVSTVADTLTRLDTELASIKRSFNDIQGEIGAQARKRHMPTSKPSVSVSRKGMRAYTDEAIRLILLPLDQAWRFEELKEDGCTVRCNTARCWFDKHSDKLHEYTGAHVSVFDPTVYYCNKCYLKCGPAFFRGVADDLRGKNPSLAKLLENEWEACYEHEPLSEVKDRAVFASEWRTLSTWKCRVCNEQGTHVLVGQPKDTLCDVHFNERHKHAAAIRGWGG